jgi:hypothetical protein
MYWQYTTAPAGSVLKVMPANPSRATHRKACNSRRLGEMTNLAHGDSS